MRFLITGYGRMGREIEKILLQRGHEIIARVDPRDEEADARALSEEVLDQAEAVIEFSLPEGLEDNIYRYVEAGIPCVIGTTGWQKKQESLQNYVEEKGGTCVFGSNFSPGAHMFFALAARAASMIDALPEYDIMLHEYHHKYKKDSPSGTALSAARQILKECTRKESIYTEKLNRPPEEAELHVSSTRGGHIPGTHTVSLDSPADSLEITHRARNRSGFALGAVLAAEWAIDKKGFIPVEMFMKEVLNV